MVSVGFVLMSCFGVNMMLSVIGLSMLIEFIM